MVDPERLADLLRRLDLIAQGLAELAALPNDRLDAASMDAVKYRFVVAAEIAIDLAHHVISSEGYPKPTTFAEAFDVLRDRGVIDDELADPLQDLARFRNVLVHLYAKVDDTRVRDRLHGDLGFLKRFRALIASRFLTS